MIQHRDLGPHLGPDESAAGKSRIQNTRRKSLLGAVERGHFPISAFGGTLDLGKTLSPSRHAIARKVMRRQKGKPSVDDMNSRRNSSRRSGDWLPRLAPAIWQGQRNRSPLAFCKNIESTQKATGIFEALRTSPGENLTKCPR